MKLTVLDRVLLGGIIPQEGDMPRMIQVKGIQEKISVKPDEADEIGMRPTEDGNGVLWNATDKEIEVTFNSQQTKIINDSFKRIDKAKKFNLQLLDLKDKFK